MWKTKLLTLSFVLLLLMSCQGDEIPTPTPFPPTRDNVSLRQVGSSITPVPTLLSDMMDNPEFYEGAYVQVTGQYFRKPLQVCGIDAYPSPAGWELVSGDIRVPAGGFDDQLRQLMPDGITMTIIGRLSQWSGPVGCGKQAVPTEMWYLDVVRLVDPAQLARVTLTPGSGDSVFDDGVGDELFTPIADAADGSPPDEDESNLIPTSPPVAPPTNTTQPTRAVPIETLGAGFTPVATEDILASTPDASRTVNPNGTTAAAGTANATTQGTAVASGTASPSASGTSTVTNTPPPGSTATSSVPLVTATSDSKSISSQGKAFEDDIYFEAKDLEQDFIHEWTVFMDEADNVVFNVIGEPNMDMVIKLLDGNSTVLVSENKNSTGQAESISFDPTVTSSNYKIQVSEVNGKTGGYLLTGSFDEFLKQPQGRLTYSTGSSGDITDTEDHYWFFKGQEGDEVSLAISCEVDAELWVILYDSDGIDYADQFFGSQIQDIFLPDTDWYIFEIGLWDEEISSCTYNLIVTN